MWKVWVAIVLFLSATCFVGYVYRPTCTAILIGSAEEIDCFKRPLLHLGARIQDERIRIAYLEGSPSYLMKKFSRRLHRYYDAIAVSSPLEAQLYKNYGVPLPIFVVDDVMAASRYFAAPQKVHLGHQNKVTENYLITTSEDLHQKYKKRAGSFPFWYHKEVTPPTSFLTPITYSPSPSGLQEIDCIYIINLDERPERWHRIQEVLKGEGLEAVRVRAVNGWKIPLAEQVQMTDASASLLSGGAVGCLLSHVSIYRDAVSRGFNTIWICEDDIEFREGKDRISALVKQLASIDPDWDLLYTDYFVKEMRSHSARPGQPSYQEIHEPVSDDLVRIHGRYNTHSMIFSKKGLAKALEYFSHVYLNAPIDVDIHYVPGIREYSARRDIVTSIYDSSKLALDGTSDTQLVSPLAD